MDTSDLEKDFAAAEERASASRQNGSGAEPREAQAGPTEEDAAKEWERQWDERINRPYREPPLPPAPVRPIPTEKPPAANPTPTSGDKMHRQYGVPDELIELLGPPPVLARHLDQFYKLLVAFAFDADAQKTTDWFIPWDQAVLRAECGQIGRAKAATIGLCYDRAAKEINRPGGLRFVERNPFKETDRNWSRPADNIEVDEPVADYDAMASELKRLGLPTASTWDLAYIVAAPLLEPVEAIEAQKRNQLRQLGEDLQRRGDRADRRRAEGGQDEAIDAEFEAVAEPQAQPSPPSPGEQTQGATSQAAPIEASLGDAEVAGLPASEAAVHDVEVPPSGVAAGGSVGEATGVVVGAREDGELF